MQALGEGIQALNFRRPNFTEQMKQALKLDISFGKKQDKEVKMASLKNK